MFFFSVSVENVCCLLKIFFFGLSLSIIGWLSDNLCHQSFFSLFADDHQRKFVCASVEERERLKERKGKLRKRESVRERDEERGREKEGERERDEER
jgi:hypothetical protein